MPMTQGVAPIPDNANVSFNIHDVLISDKGLFRDNI